MEFENKVVLITGGGGGIGKAAAERFGGVDVLVNSTGIFRIKPFEEESEEDFEEAMNSILRPTFYTSQAAVGEMRRRGGGAIVTSAPCGPWTRSPPPRPAPTPRPRPAATP